MVFIFSEIGLVAQNRGRRSEDVENEFETEDEMRTTAKGH